MEPHELDLYYRRTYGITLVFYDAELAKQGGVCKICLRPPKQRRLAVEHDHRILRFKIRVKRFVGECLFVATIAEHSVDLKFEAGSAAGARKAAKLHLMRESFRGLVCHRCNRGIQFFNDCAARLRRAADYVERKLG